MRTRLILAAVLALSLAAASPVQAQYGMMGQGQGQGPGYQAAPAPDPATAQALFNLQRDYYNKVLPLNGKLQAQYAELYGLLYVKDPDQGRIKKVVAAISELQGQLLQESVAFGQEVYKKTGYPVGLGMMMGPGMMGGYGMMGYGMMGYGGGYGPGMMGGYGMMGPGYGWGNRQ